MFTESLLWAVSVLVDGSTAKNKIRFKNPCSLGVCILTGEM